MEETYFQAFFKKVKHCSGEVSIFLDTWIRIVEIIRILDPIFKTICQKCRQ